MNVTYKLLQFTISIHAPREGGDEYRGGAIDNILDISIHAPREGGDYDP